MEMTNLEKFDFLTKVWTLIDEARVNKTKKKKTRQNKFRSQSMIDFGFLDEYKSKYNFNYTKSAWRTDYGDIL